MPELALVPPWFAAVTVVLLGLVVGSFLNVVILRLPRMLEARWALEYADTTDASSPTPEAALSLSHPRSHCPDCGAPIRVWHNIPLIGYLLLGGRCANCGRRISWQYPAVEALSAVLAVFVFLRFGLTPAAGAVLLATWLLLAMAVIDWRTQLLPDVLTLSLLWLGLLASLFDGRLVAVSPADAILGAAAGYGLLWIVFQLFRLVTGKQGMGYGDFKLLAALGAWVGWQQLPLLLLMASVAGSLVGMALIAARQTERGTPMPFGPWLAAAGWLALVAGDTIMSAYLTVSGLR